MVGDDQAVGEHSKCAYLHCIHEPRRLLQLASPNLLNYFGCCCFASWRGLRDLFIPPGKRPPRNVLPYWMYDLESEDELPLEHWQRARDYNFSRLTRPVFSAWLGWLRARKLASSRAAEGAHAMRKRKDRATCRVVLITWRQHTARTKKLKAAALAKFMHGRKEAFMRACFMGWVECARATKRAALWFEEQARLAAQREADPGTQRSDLFSFLLPYSLRVKIFSFVSVEDLASCALVCRSWQEVTQDADLWVHVDLAVLGSRVQDFYVEKLSDRFRTTMGSLAMSGCSQLGNAALAAIGHARNLHSLDCSNCPLVGVRQLVCLRGLSDGTRLVHEPVFVLFVVVSQFLSLSVLFMFDFGNKLHLLTWHALFCSV
eukprot:m.238167 g.238167  ORF g.238167 m.238167 type:complete len:374 (-) comp18965_c0_seq9:1413-2534(-)